MFIRDRAGGFQFHDEAILNDQVGEVLTQDGSVLVINGQGVLKFHLKAKFLKAMKQGSLIDLLQMPRTVIVVDGISCFADDIT